MLLCGYGVKVLPVVQGAAPCQQHWDQGRAVGGVAGVHTS
jgi:hypothetical protein